MWKFSSLLVYNYYIFNALFEKNYLTDDNRNYLLCNFSKIRRKDFSNNLVTDIP